MLTKDEVATLESLIRRMSSVQRDALQHWLNDFYDWEFGARPAPMFTRPSCGRQPNDRPLQERIEEAQDHAAWRVENGGAWLDLCEEDFPPIGSTVG